MPRTPLAALALLACIAGGAARAAPVLESLSPVAQTFAFGTDFTLAQGSGIGEVTAALSAVDLTIPVATAGTSTSGCEAADFAGFAAGSIALIERGACTFGVKVANALAAGAGGVLLFNDGAGGAPDRTGIIELTLGSDFTLPVLFASFAVGDLLRNGVVNGATGTVLHMRVTEADLAPTVPEPGTLALAGLALAGLFGVRRGAKPTAA